MKIEMKPLVDITPYESNPRFNDHAVDAVATSLREFGFRQPIVVDADGVIVCGHTRYKAAMQLGLEKAPVHVAKDLSPEQIKAYRIADNKTGEIAEWNFDLLPLELAELRELDFDLDTLGFSDDELEVMFEAEREPVDIEEDEVPEPPVNTVTRPGDLWLLGEHRLLCGDSRKAEDVERLMDGAKAEITVLDPPFDAPDSAWVHNITDPCVLFGQARHIRRVPDDLWRFERVIIKKYRHRSATVQIDHRHAFVVQVGSVKTLPNTTETFPSVIEQEVDREHDHAKPVRLVVEHLTKWVTEWSLVYDPFLGSGTTLIAAEQLGRRCYGLEINPAYCDVIVKRWEKLTGRKATRVPAHAAAEENAPATAEA